MSFQLEIPHPQIKQTLVNYVNVVDDGILVSPPIIPITLDLFHTKQSLSQLKFLENLSKSKQQKRSLDNQYCEEKMNRKNEKSKMPKLELKLNLSPPSSPVRPESPSSCVSSETSSAEIMTSMVLVGCPRCLMYVMLPEDDPKCPKCKSTVLLDFLHNNHNDDDDDDDKNDNNLGNIGSCKRTKRS